MTKRTKRILIITPIVLVLALVLIVFIALLNINRIVKAGVNNVVPKVTKTTASLGSANISPFTGKGTLTDFDLGNPEGYKMEHALQFKSVSVDINLRSLLTDTIIINDITIDGPVITYERGLTESNLDAILKNVQDFAGGPSPEKKEEPQKPGKKIIIRHLLITNAKVIGSIKGLGAGAGIPLPKIEMTDIGKETGGASPATVAADVLNKITDFVKKVPGAIVDIGKGAVDVGKGAVDAGKGFIKGAGDLIGGKKD